MKNNSFVLEKKLLDRIYRNITSRLNQIDNNGLSEGKIGIVLFLYYYAQIIDSDKIREEADTLLDDVWESINSEEQSYLFFSGHSGIVWSLFWLGRKGFLDIDDTLDPYTKRLDFYIFREQKTQTPVLIDMESGLFSSGLYLLSRCKQIHINLLEDCNWQETAIYLIEDCERILYKKTSCNNAFLPELTLSILNSILYFLIEVHKQRIYPHKTATLIEYSKLQIEQLTKESCIQDIITSKILLSLIDDIEYSSMDLDLAKKIEEADQCILNILAEAGLNSLLYDNKLIFEETLLFTLKHKTTDINNLCSRIYAANLSVKTLLGVGYGLLMMLEKK